MYGVSVQRYNWNTVTAAADLSQSCNALHRLLQQGLDDHVCD